LGKLEEFPGIHIPDQSLVSFIHNVGTGTIATVAEIILGLFLLLGLKTELMAKLSGYLLLLFALSMTFSLGIKTPFDYSVFSASAAAFSLSMIKEKFCELDALIARNER